jgi:S1-C subfamily serine protease
MRVHRHGPMAALCLALLRASAWGAAPAIPHGSAAEFEKKLTRDTHDSPTRTQPAVSSAEVVQRILPSVVSLRTYSSSARRGVRIHIPHQDLEMIPPRVREFFDAWLGCGDSPPPGENSGQPAPKATQPGFGSGVLLTRDGYLLSNHRAVAKAEPGFAMQLKLFRNGRTKFVALKG